MQQWQCQKMQKCLQLKVKGFSEAHLMTKDFHEDSLSQRQPDSASAMFVFYVMYAFPMQ